MYRKMSNSWLKHWDFIVLDLIFLQIAYVFSCVARNGFYNPYENQVYRNIGIILCLLDICAAFFWKITGESCAEVISRSLKQF